MEQSTGAHSSPVLTPPSKGKKSVCSAIHQFLADGGLFSDGGASHGGSPRWRISPEPFGLTWEEVDALHQLGSDLLSFYRALNQFYFKSVKGQLPKWVSSYLDQGKPESLITYSRMNRFKHHLPFVLRPDLMMTADGMIATELDSVPGGIGITGSLSEAYGNQAFEIVGGSGGMAEGFARATRALAHKENPVLGVVISEESKEYRPEMKWLGKTLDRNGLRTVVLEPRDIHFSEEGLWTETEGGPLSLDVCYRFFELFDLMNVPKSELVLYSAKKGRVALTPPVKPYLEEKLAFALFHHPSLESAWVKELGEATHSRLKKGFPHTWVLDPRPLPPYGTVPGLSLKNRSVQDWMQLAEATQQERRFVVKPSGFSERAWGSRGVYVGHDLPARDWETVLKKALSDFAHSPWILQKFHKARLSTMEYYDVRTQNVISMEGRIRLSPYYFVIDGEAVLSGALATFCPKDKKLLHGMEEAIMAPCSVRPHGKGNPRSETL